MNSTYKNEFALHASDPLLNKSTEIIGREQKNIIAEKKYYKIIDLSFF